MNNFIDSNINQKYNTPQEGVKGTINQGFKEQQQVDGINNRQWQQDQVEILQNMKTQGLQEISDVIEKLKYWITQFESELQKLKRNIMMKLDEAINLAIKWTGALEQIIKQEDNFNLDTIEIQKGQYSKQIQMFKKKYINYIKQVNSSFQQKIIQAKDSLKKEIQENKIEMLFKDFPILESEIQKIESTKGNYKLINEISQKEFCYSIAFNRQGTIMVSCSQDEIKIWRFQDGKQIDCIQKIQGDSDIDYATSLVFSRKNNYFISGSFDSSIKLYYNENDKWFKQAGNISHGGLVTCVILNNQEDQLISCSQDSLIFIWKINLASKSIWFDQSLKRHEKVILSLSINKQDTEFVSTGYDQKIIIWKKDLNQRWVFNQLIDHQYSDVGCRVSYITDTFIVWQQSNQPYIHFFESQQGMYVQKHKMKLEQSKSKTETYLFLFPSLYNYEKKVLISKFNNEIYFIHFDKETKQFKVDSNHIECSSSMVFGNWTQDGKYLVIWDYLLKQYQIYELCYE